MPWPRSRAGAEPALPLLLFLERTALSEPVAVELERPMAVHPRVTGFWRAGRFHRVVKIVETRYEYGEMYVRAVTDEGAVDLRRTRRRDPRTFRARTQWELCGELEAFEIPRSP